jgi:hypothetical protein
MRLHRGAGGASRLLPSQFGDKSRRACALVVDALILPPYYADALS